MRWLLKAMTCCIAVLLPAHALSWGSPGHQVVANIAYAQLSPKARIEVDRLLALEAGATLTSVSTWADEHRNPSTAPWHYVNFPRGTCEFDPVRDCPDGRCVVGAIEKQIAILGSGVDDEKRLLALKYLVHFVGDVHQPLHAGYAEDRGGNSYQLQAFMKGSNLHAVWDSGLIRNLNEDELALSKRLLSKPSPTETLKWNATQAAEESCQIVGQPGFYPDRLVDMDYIKKFTPVMEARLAQAGRRLAALLNSIL